MSWGDPSYREAAGHTTDLWQELTEEARPTSIPGTESWDGLGGRPLELPA